VQIKLLRKNAKLNTTAPNDYIIAIGKLINDDFHSGKRSE